MNLVMQKGAPRVRYEPMARDYVLTVFCVAGFVWLFEIQGIQDPGSALAVGGIWMSVIAYWLWRSFMGMFYGMQNYTTLSLRTWVHIILTNAGTWAVTLLAIKGDINALYGIGITLAAGGLSFAVRRLSRSD